MPTLPLPTILLRLGIAALLGALIGLERERLDRAAGLRTHVLVALASALMMLVSGYSFPELPAVQRDPTRMAAQVISGIGFLGAGVIIFRKNTVRGLTTAASIWSVAGIGLAAGGGLLEVAGIGTAFILLAQVGLRPIERRFFVGRQEHRLTLQIRRGANRLTLVERIIGAEGVELRGLRLRPTRGGADDRAELDLGAARAGAVTAVIEALRAIEGVRLVTYSRGTAKLLPANGADDADESEAADNDSLMDDDRQGG